MHRTTKNKYRIRISKIKTIYPPKADQPVAEIIKIQILKHNHPFRILKLKQLNLSFDLAQAFGSEVFDRELRPNRLRLEEMVSLSNHLEIRY
jgi:hypothetical protein